MCILRFFLVCILFSQSAAVLAGWSAIEGDTDLLTQQVNNGFILAAKDNPWALPQTQQIPAFPRYYDSSQDAPVQTPSYPSYQQPDHNEQAVRNGSQQPDNSRYQRPDSSSSRQQYMFQLQPRFVTPEILDTIKKQQMRTQQVPLPWQRKTPRNYNRYKEESKRDNSADNRWALDTVLPASPDTLIDETLLYQGEPLPLVPNAALGGISPFSTYQPLPPELSTDGYQERRSFDPYEFGPFGDFIGE